MDHFWPVSIKMVINQLRLSERLASIFGCTIIAAWTMIRFFNHGPNFDQLGQQVLAHQWLHGQHSGSVIGPTNYVLKMLLLYTPFDFLPLPAQFKLVFMTMLVNVATFILLVYVLKRIWLEFYPKVKDTFYLPVVYLSLISGSVYWMSFTNSRNLEVVGGLFLIYLYIRTQKHPSLRYYALLILLGSLLFFADPLQIYMTLLPLVLFIGLRWGSKREQLGVLLKLMACAAISIVLAHFLTRIVEAMWNVSFISSERSVSFSISSIRLSIEQMARLYAGGFEGGRLREFINLFVVIAGIAGATYYAWCKPKSRSLIGLVGIVWIVDLSIYIISGQAQQIDTNRYLIMTVPLFILALAVNLYYLSATKILSWVVAFVLLLNAATLGWAFTKAWNPSFSNNNHDRSVIIYIKEHKYSYGYSSIGTALSSNYLSNWQVNVLPLGCDPDYTLKKTSLFFDKAAFNIAEQSDANTLVPIVLDGKDIKINVAACGVDQIQKQLGGWQTLDYLSDGSTVLLYKANQLDKLRGISL